MKALVDLQREILNLYAYEVEMCGAIHQWNKMLKTVSKGSKTGKMFVGRSDPNDPNAKYQYAKSFRDLISASSKNGTHENTLRRTVVALTYSLWEDQYRKRIAYECGKDDRNDIKSDVFHDLNKYRQAVLHAGGRLVGTPKVIRFFGNGEEVLLTEEQMYKLFSIITDELNRIGRVYYDHDPNFSLDQPLRTK